MSDGDNSETPYANLGPDQILTAIEASPPELREIYALVSEFTREYLNGV